MRSFSHCRSLSITRHSHAMQSILRYAMVVDDERLVAVSWSGE